MYSGEPCTHCRLIRLAPLALHNYRIIDLFGLGVAPEPPQRPSEATPLSKHVSPPQTRGRAAFFAPIGAKTAHFARV
jgi:hypothetical protein